MSIKTVKPTKVLLVAILLIAAFLRFGSAYPGYPPYHSDEGMSYSQGIAMVKESTLNPISGYALSYAYPALVPLINALFFKLFFIPLAWLNYYVGNIGRFLDGVVNFPLTPEESKRVFQIEILGIREIYTLTWGRYIASLVGVANVILIYILGRNLFNKYVALVAAFLVAVNYRQVLNSTLGLPDIYNAFFLTLSLILSYRIYKSGKKADYLLAGMFVGLSVSTKFHIYALPPLLLAHLYKDFKNLRYLLLSLGAAALTIMLVSPYHFVNYTETLIQLESVSKKYQIGSYTLSAYPYSYLYRIGVGKFASLFAIVGIVVGIVYKPKQTIYLLFTLIPFFIVVTYLTDGGFYTRNFITITPLLMITSALAIYYISKYLHKLLNSKIPLLILIVSITVFTSKENILNSYTIFKEYRVNWNYIELSDWIRQNIPASSKIAAHSSVPLPAEDVVRLPLEVSEFFSVSELKSEGADFAIVNMDWVANGYYWWMKEKGAGSLRHWNKPVEVLQESFVALAMYEMSDFVIYSAVNDWRAPDSNFIVIRLPKINLIEKELVQSYEFEKPSEEWKYKVLNITEAIKHPEIEGTLTFADKYEPAAVYKWESVPVDVSGWSGLVVESKSKAVPRNNNSNINEGYIYVKFFPDLSSAQKSKKLITTRLSSRNNKPNIWNSLTIVSDIPPDSKFMVIGFRRNDPAKAKIYLDSVEVYNAKVEVDMGNWEISPLNVTDDFLFPNSHGNL